MNLDRPIGVFDSGFGGLTVARSMIDLLPDEQLVYVGDSARYPYGPRPSEEVGRFSREIASYLLEAEDVKMIVIACNTAASVVLEEFERELPVPVIGVIEPGLRSASLATRNGQIGVIGTTGTIASGAYQKKAIELALGAKVHCAACPGFVEFVERGELESEQVHVLAQRLLSPLRELDIDTLLLGCTHYPFLARTISDVMGRDVVLVSSADETAFEVRRALSRFQLARHEPNLRPHRFLSSGDVDWFAEMGRRLLGPEMGTATHVDFSRRGRGTGAA